MPYCVRVHAVWLASSYFAMSKLITGCFRSLLVTSGNSTISSFVSRRPALTCFIGVLLSSFGLLIIALVDRHTPDNSRPVLVGLLAAGASTVAAGSSVTTVAADWALTSRCRARAQLDKLGSPSSGLLSAAADEYIDVVRRGGAGLPRHHETLQSLVQLGPAGMGMALIAVLINQIMSLVVSYSTIYVL